MELETEADGRMQITTVEELRRRLSALDTETNTFAILSKDQQTYVQAAAAEDGFIVEKRDGDSTRHFYAARPGLHQRLRPEPWLIPKGDRGQDRFTRDEMTAVLSSYFSGDPMPVGATWVRMEMADPNALGTKVIKALRITFWAILVLLFVGLFLWLRTQR
jgi:hypothetical protein